MDVTPDTSPRLPPPPPPAAPPPSDRPRYWLHAALFVLAFLSAILAQVLPETGAPSLLDSLALLLREPSRLVSGLPFAAALMAILSAHEMGHYLTARRYGVRQSLPYFIPAPTVFGTLGALILMRSQPRNRRVLLHVAVMGPYAGMLVAIPATIWGLANSTAATAESLQTPGYVFGSSLLFGWLSSTFGPGAALIDLHPVALAGWVGLFVTSLNLIPAAQLDGGHVAYALFGPRQEQISFVVVLLLFGLGVFLGFERGLVWVLWSIFLFVIGLRHPPVRNETTPLTLPQRANAWVALLVFIATFTPVPIAGVAVQASEPPPQRVRPFEDYSYNSDDDSRPSPAEEFRL